MKPVVLLVLALGACSYGYALQVVERDGAIVFQPDKDHGTGCLAEFSVKTTGGAVMWDIYADAYTPPPCASRLPLTYGVVPNGMKVRVRATPLVANTDYLVNGWDGDSYRGAFRFRQGIVVDNIDYQTAGATPSWKSVE